MRPSALPVLRTKLALWAALALLAAPLSAQAVCGGGSTSSLPPPAVTFLRSYRAGLNAPTRLAADAAGNVYVTDPVRGAVVVRAADGHIVSRRTGLGQPIGIAVGADGRIYVGDASSGAVAVFAPDWQLLFLLGRGEGEFLSPGAIAIDPGTGNAYVADGKMHLVRVFDRSGALLTGFGGFGPEEGRFNFPAALFVDGARVLVADQMNYRIQVFDLAGGFLYCFGSQGSGAGRFNAPQGLAVDGAGRVYVADAFEGRIQVLDAGGGFVAYLGDFGEEPGRLRVPTDLVIDPSNRLFVAAANNARLEIFGLESFSDPERIVPADAEVEPDPLDRSEEPESVAAYIEIPGYALRDVAPETVTVNGVAAYAASATVGDRDGDAIPDLRIEVDGPSFVSTLPDEGDAPVAVSGSVGDKQFEASGTIRVLAGGNDDDDDGVANRDDLCPGTQPGEAVNAQGCSIDQLCPCAGPAGGGSWKSHRQYVKCVKDRAGEFLTNGWIDEVENTAIIRRAKDSDCGRGSHP